MLKDIKDILKLPELYYSESTNQAKYSKSVGIFSLERALQNKSDIFRLPVGVSKKNLKTLVIMDPTVFFWSGNKTEHVKQCLNELMRAGFTIYAPDSDRMLYELYTEESQKIYPSQMDLTEDEIIDFTPELKTLPRSQIQFINRSHFQKILSCAFEEYYVSDDIEIDADEVTQIVEEAGYNIWKLQKSLERQEHKKVKFVLNDVQNKIFEELDLPYELRINTISLPSDMDELPRDLKPSDFSPAGITLRLDGVSQDDVQQCLDSFLGKTEIFELYLCNVIGLWKRFNELPMKKLIIEHTGDPYEIRLTWEQLSHLRELRVIGFEASDFEFSRCDPRNYQNLKKLLIERNNDLLIIDYPTWTGETPGNLQEITLAKSTITVNTFEKFIGRGAKSHIRKICLDECKIIFPSANNTNNDSEIDLKYLVTLEFDENKRLTSIGYASLIFALYHGRIKPPSVDNPFSHLFEIDLSSRFFTTDEKVEIIKKCHHLEKLHVHEEDLDAIVQFASSSLKGIKTLYVVNSYMSHLSEHDIAPATNLLFKLFSSIDCLEKLEFCGDFINAFRIDQRFSGCLKNLKEFNADYIDMSFISSIFRFSPLIKMKVKSPSPEKVNIPLDKSSTLIDLTITSNDFDNSCLIDLINSAPNLVKLSIEDLDDSLKDFDKKLIHTNLSRLSTLIISGYYTPATKLVIESLLGAASRVRQLEMHHSYITDGFDEPLDLSPQSLPQLIHVYIDLDSFLVFESIVIPISDAARNLRFLKVRGIAALHPTNLFDTSELFKRVEIFDVSCSNLISSETWDTYAGQMDAIRELRIKDVPDFGQMNLDEDSLKFHIIHDRMIESIIEDQEVNRHESYQGTRDPHDLTPSMDTEKRDSTKNAVIFFIDKENNQIDPATYRLCAIESIIKKPGLFSKNGRPFEYKFSDRKQMISCDDIIISTQPLEQQFFNLSEVENEEKHHFGHIKIHLTNEYRVIPMPTAWDKILTIYSPYLTQDDYKVEFDQKTREFCIRLLKLESLDTSIQYITHRNLPDPVPSAKLQNIINEYYNSPVEEINGMDGSYTADEWLSKLIETRGGACRHKVNGFFFEVEQIVHECFLTPARGHIIAEVRETESSPPVQCDLGGYPLEFQYDQGMFSKTAPPAVDPRESIQDNTPENVTQIEDIRLNPAFKNKTIHAPDSPQSLAFHLISGYAGKNLIVDFRDDPAVDMFQKLIRQVAKSSSRPLVYIDSPDDINCYHLHMSQEGSTRREHGGELYDLLTKTHSNHPIILVNWNRFTAEQIVQFNSLIDKNRIADGVPVPKNVTVVGLYNSHRRDAYKGSDFTSRRDELFEPDFTAESISNHLNKRDESNQNNSFLSVNLHHSDDWQSLLCGRWKMTESGWKFETNKLVEAIETGKSIRIHDAPWRDRDFLNFINKINLEKRIEIGGVVYHIPENFVIEEGADYQLQENAEKKLQFKHLSADSSLPLGVEILNPITFSHFFNPIKVEGDSIVTPPGLLASIPEGGTLSVYLSDPLTEPQWGQLVDTLDINKKLVIYSDPTIQIPDVLREFISTEVVTFTEDRPSFLTVFESNNHQLAVKDLNTPNALIIDCSDMEISDLFESIERTQDSDNLSFRQHEGAVITALRNKQDVILTGNYSNELLQYLVYWNNKKHDYSGSVTLITEKELPSLRHVSKLIKKEFDDSIQTQNQKTILEEPDDSRNFVAMRMTLLQRVLSDHPICHLTGPTGAGKSTFMLDFLAKTPGVKLSHDMDKFEEWIKPSEGNEIKILFIDEANIAGDKKHNWTEFAGLLNNHPPQIVVNKKIITLTGNHKVVFAGNAQGYGGERETPALFTQYNIPELRFKNISIKQIEKTLLSDIPELTSEVKAIFINMYELVRSLPSSEPLISPRELEHMVNLFLIYRSRCPDVPLNKLAKQCAYRVASQAVPPEYIGNLGKNPGDLLLLTESTKNQNNQFKHFLVTQSRQSAESRINEFLAIRHMKRHGEIKFGLGGLILEGEPGCGKSEQIIAQLVALGFKENKSFIRISSHNLSYDEKMEKLKKAYQEGMIVVDDEINSRPAFERFYNAAMQGKVPGIDNPKPGFLLLGTMNPTNKYEGRRALSPALRRRVFIEKIPDMPAHEMIQTLIQVYKVKNSLAIRLVNDFIEASKASAKPLSLRVLFNRYQEALKYIDDPIDNAQSTSKTYSPSGFGKRSDSSDDNDSHKRNKHGPE